MKIPVLLAALFALLGSSFTPVQDPPDMEKEMAKAKKWMSPGKNHEVLKKFLGSWITETTIMGSPAATKGTSEIEWLMEGRWIRIDSKSTLFGKPFHSFTIMGYDNFKMCFVSTGVSTFDTMMIHNQGNLDQSGKSLVSYGTIDEYMTGERDKPVKVAWRFTSEDKMTMEVHDLAIGETNTKVFEIVYTRKK